MDHALKYLQGCYSCLSKNHPFLNRSINHDGPVCGRDWETRATSQYLTSQFLIDSLSSKLFIRQFVNLQLIFIYQMAKCWFKKKQTMLILENCKKIKLKKIDRQKYRQDRYPMKSSGKTNLFKECSERWKEFKCIWKKGSICGKSSLE